MVKDHLQVQVIEGKEVILCVFVCVSITRGVKEGEEEGVGGVGGG
jgi:hypothetical protein